MKILVANLGSTSFKFRLFDMADERLVARGGVDRIGSDGGQCVITVGSRRITVSALIPDHVAAMRLCLRQLSESADCLHDIRDLSAVGFKAVHARGMSGVRRLDNNVLGAMAAYADVAPAHNPPYLKAMWLLSAEFPELPLVAAFETDFHQSVAPSEYLYAVPLKWAQRFGVRRWGFHGASHRFVAERAGELLDSPNARIISCHLGGSSSVCAISEGMSQACSFGMSPQSGLPHNNRVGDFDPFALPVLMQESGMTLEAILDDLANRSGLLGLSGGIGDFRDLEMDPGPIAAQAVAVFVASVRRYVGAYLVLLNGADAIVFTGGIGENSAGVRAAVCANLDWFDIYLDPLRNDRAVGEMPLQASRSRVQIWTMPTNEELIVARQVKSLLTSEK
jgi:acetate kinase